jgi:hypothetical protein
MQIGAGDANLVVPLEGLIDVAAEKARLAKALAASEKERDSLAKRLENPAFVEKAKPEAIDKARADHAAHAAEATRLPPRCNGWVNAHAGNHRGGPPGNLRRCRAKGPRWGGPRCLCGSRCNLACRWCDTAYTWRFEGDNRPHTDGIAFDRAANQIGMGEERWRRRSTIWACACPRTGW